MADENSFLLINLKEESSKDIAKVISNDTCRKILDFLANNADSTETDISKKLGLPISTVHYNLKHLVKGKLVVADEYHYSKKGKEIAHYKLANKFIIIAPDETKENKSIFQKLKEIIPLSVFALAATGALMLRKPLMAGNVQFSSDMEAFDYAPASGKAMEDAATSEAMARSAEFAPLADAPTQTASQAASEPSIALWFLIGAGSVILFFAIYRLIKHYRGKKRSKR